MHSFLGHGVVTKTEKFGVNTTASMSSTTNMDHNIQQSHKNYKIIINPCCAISKHRRQVCVLHAYSQR